MRNTLALFAVVLLTGSTIHAPAASTAKRDTGWDRQPVTSAARTWALDGSHATKA